MKLLLTCWYISEICNPRIKKYEIFKILDNLLYFIIIWTYEGDYIGQFLSWRQLLFSFKQSNNGTRGIDLCKQKIETPGTTPVPRVLLSANQRPVFGKIHFGCKRLYIVVQGCTWLLQPYTLCNHVQPFTTIIYHWSFDQILASDWLNL